MPEQVERRKSDSFIHERIDSLSTRLDSVEKWAESFEYKMVNVGNEVQANTALTEDIHGKTDEMYQMFAAARNAFRMLTSIANFGLRLGGLLLRLLRFLGALAKPALYIIGFCAAVWAWYKTGHFTMPDWLK